MSKDNKVIVSIFGGLSILILVVGTLLVNKSQPKNITATSDAKVAIIGPNSHGWGEIPIDGGNVEKTFQIKNEGTTDLAMSNLKTSCMCTEAMFVIDGNNSPVFGMHTKSNWVGVLKPGQTADVKVVFDPMFHGPQATGPITRLVSFNTNDRSNPTVEFRLTGNVIKE